MQRICNWVTVSRIEPNVTHWKRNAASTPRYITAYAFRLRFYPFHCSLYGSVQLINFTTDYPFHCSLSIFVHPIDFAAAYSSSCILLNSLQILPFILMTLLQLILFTHHTFFFSCSLLFSLQLIHLVASYRLQRGFFTLTAPNLSSKTTKTFNVRPKFDGVLYHDVFLVCMVRPAAL